MPEGLLFSCFLLNGSSYRATLGCDVISANSSLCQSFCQLLPMRVEIVHAEQVTDFPPVFLHIAWVLILAWGSEADSLRGGCWGQTTEMKGKTEITGLQILAIKKQDTKTCLKKTGLVSETSTQRVPLLLQSSSCCCHHCKTKYAISSTVMSLCFINHANIQITPHSHCHLSK